VISAIIQDLKRMLEKSHAHMVGVKPGHVVTFALKQKNT
jgi:hypothetical protein